MQISETVAVEVNDRKYVSCVECRLLNLAFSYLFISSVV